MVLENERSAPDKCVPNETRSPEVTRRDVVMLGVWRCKVWAAQSRGGATETILWRGPRGGKVHGPWAEFGGVWRYSSAPHR